VVVRDGVGCHDTDGEGYLAGQQQLRAAYLKIALHHGQRDGARRETRCHKPRAVVLALAQQERCGVATAASSTAATTAATIVSAVDLPRHDHEMHQRLELLAGEGQAQRHSTARPPRCTAGKRLL
jgi:hypothetical protein